MLLASQLIYYAITHFCTGYTTHRTRLHLATAKTRVLRYESEATSTRAEIIILKSKITHYKTKSAAHIQQARDLQAQITSLTQRADFHASEFAAGLEVDAREDFQGHARVGVEGYAAELKAEAERNRQIVVKLKDDMSWEMECAGKCRVVAREMERLVDRLSYYADSLDRTARRMRRDVDQIGRRLDGVWWEVRW